MNKIKLITDSSADLSNDLVKKYNIDVIPLIVNIGGESYLDGVELTANRLFEIIEITGNMPQSASPSPVAFHEVFSQYIDEGYDIIYTGIAGELSATLNVAKLAAEEFPEGRIHVIDSKSLSSGIALILLRAARLIEQGKSVEEVVQEIKDVRERVRAQFVVEKLDFLYRGGRLSSAKYVLGKAVRARPYLVVAQGRIEAVGLPKGKMKRALKLQLESFKRHYEEGIDESMIFVTSAGNRGDEYADYYVKKLVEYIPRENIVVQKVGSVISTHCGEGTVGILYIRDVKNDFNN